MKKSHIQCLAAFGFGIFTPRRLHGHAKPAGVGSVDLWHGDRVHYGPLGSRNRRRASDTDQSGTSEKRTQPTGAMAYTLSLICLPAGTRLKSR